MKKQIKQKGFIQIPLLVGIIIAVASITGVGVVLHKQEKLTSLFASISGIIEPSRPITEELDFVEQEEQEELVEPSEIAEKDEAEDKNEKPIISDYEKAQQELERTRLEAEKMRVESERLAEEQRQAELKRQEILRKAQEEAERLKVEAEQLERIRQEELKKQKEEQEKVDKINNLIAEYNRKLIEIEKEILTREEKYQKDLEQARFTGRLASRAEAEIRRLTEDFFMDANKLELQKKNLRLEYLEKIREIDPFFNF